MAANGQKLRVAVTKTSAQGKAAQSSTPNLMSFSTDENSIWFNGKKYGVHLFNNIPSLTTNSTSEQVLAALNVSNSSELYDLANKGVLFVDKISGNTVVEYENGDSTFQLYWKSGDSKTVKKITINNSTHKVTNIAIINILSVSDIKNTLTDSSTTAPLSAAMGKKLNDEKLAIANIVNNLSDTSTNKALSAAQGKVLNDKISALGSVYRIKGTKANISEVLALTDAKVGDVWNVTNAFTFGGKPYPANTNIVCITATSSSDHDENNWDPIGGTVDLSPYLSKSDAAYTYLKQSEAESTYATKEELNALDTDYNSQLDAISNALDTKLNKADVVNNLTSTNTDKPLSAAQGKKLQDEKLAKTEASNTYATKASLADATPYVLPGDMTGILMGMATTGENVKSVFGTPKNISDAWTAGKVFIGNRGGAAGQASTKGGIPLTIQYDATGKKMQVVVIDPLIKTMVSFDVPFTNDTTWGNITNYKSLNLDISTGITIE